MVFVCLILYSYAYSVFRMNNVHDIVQVYVFKTHKLLLLIKIIIRVYYNLLNIISLHIIEQNQLFFFFYKTKKYCFFFFFNIIFETKKRFVIHVTFSFVEHRLTIIMPCLKRYYILYYIARIRKSRKKLMT